MISGVVDWLVYGVMGLSSATAIGQAMHYFIYDSIELLVLLFLTVAVIGTIRTYIPPTRLKRWLGHNSLKAHVAASAFGAVTPFCSCSSIPIFIGLLTAGVPLGVSFSFLITSPLVNEYLVVLMLATFGWRITAVYVVAGMLLGIIGGMVLGRLRLEKHLDADMLALPKERRYSSFKQRAMTGLSESVKLVRRLWYWILIGVGIGAIIHNFVPQTTVESVMRAGGIFTVPVAVVLGVPLYANPTALVPIAQELFIKGVPLGTALAFMMATVALSLPEAVILRRAMNLRLILIFFGVVAASIILVGYLINALQPLLV
jgi:uncharacterized membrane protein YraQ (UPF0718 family)